MATISQPVSLPTQSDYELVADNKPSQVSAPSPTLVIEEATFALEFARDQYIHMCDDECYDSLDCDYEHFDQYSDHFVSALSTPALSASPSPAPTVPSTPRVTPVAPLSDPLSSTMSLGERLLLWGTALGSTALQAILPAEEDDHTLHLAPRKHTIAESIILASSACGCAPTPAVLLEPARPSAHVRFLVKPQAQQKSLVVPSIVAFGSSIFNTPADQYIESSEEEYEVCEEEMEF